MSKTVTLKDGTEVRLRELTLEDAPAFLRFLDELSVEDLRYLRLDVRNHELVLEKLREMSPDRTVRIVAEVEDRIVADGALEMAGPGWEEDIGEIRLLVAPSFRRKGLASVLARELYYLGISKGLRRFVARIMRPQREAREVLRRLGFLEGAIFPDHVTDRAGRRQDLLVFTCDLEEMNRELRHIFESSDWQRHR